MPLCLLPFSLPCTLVAFLPFCLVAALPFCLVAFFWVNKKTFLRLTILVQVNRLTNHSCHINSKDTQKEGVMHPIAYSIITGVILLGIVLSFYFTHRNNKNDSDFNIYS